MTARDPDTRQMHVVSIEELRCHVCRLRPGPTTEPRRQCPIHRCVLSNLVDNRANAPGTAKARLMMHNLPFEVIGPGPVAIQNHDKRKAFASELLQELTLRVVISLPQAGAGHEFL